MILVDLLYKGSTHIVKNADDHIVVIRIRRHRGKVTGWEIISHLGFEDFDDRVHVVEYTKRVLRAGCTKSELYYLVGCDDWEELND